MKKPATKILVLLATMMTALSLTGCSSDDADRGTDPSVDTPAVTTSTDPTGDTASVDPTAEASEELSDEDFVDVMLQLAANQMKSELPIDIDEMTRLDSVEAPGNGVLCYNYTLKVAPGDLTDEQVTSIEDGMRSHLLASLKSDPSMNQFRAYKVTFEVIYKYLDESTALSFGITPEEYL